MGTPVDVEWMHHLVHYSEKEEKLPFVLWTGDNTAHLSRFSQASQVALVVKTLSLGQEDPQEEGIATLSIFLPEESHGQRSLSGYGP